MSLSLIIPVYNESNQISYTLSKLNKIKDKIKKFEIILVDDFSTDNSIEVINKIACDNSCEIKIENKLTHVSAEVAQNILIKEL